MKRYLFLVLAFLVTAGIAFTGLNKKNDREKYEEFLLKQASKFEQFIPAGDGEVKAPDQPDMAAFQEYIMTVDPSLGYVPKERLWDAREYTLSLMKDQQARRDYDPPVEWEGTGANMGGRTRTIMFDPNYTNKVWAGGVTGGLWYNDDITDLSVEWIPVGDFWPDLAVSCMAYDPDDHQTFYVGTGEAQTARIIYRESSGLGAGIFKTEDGGETWELLESTSGFKYITDLVVRDEDGTGVIYAGVASGTYMGEDHESQPSDGLYRSDDGGQTWEQVLPTIPGFTNDPYAPADIEIAANGRIFVGTMENINKKGGATVLYSDTGLPGSWTVYDHYNTVIKNESYYKIPARTIIAVAPSDSNRVYAQFAAGYVNGFTYYRGRYIAKSSDGGVTWTQVTRPDNNWSTLAWHAFILQVDPSDPDVIFTGGLDLWKSQNAGSSWKHVSDWSLMYWGGGDEYVHADQHNIQYKPGTPATAIFSCDGGVFLTNTANQSSPVFIERNQGYNTLQFYTCAISPTPGAKKYIGGLQDNGTLYYNNAPLDINDMIDGGDGAYCFWDHNQSSIFITSYYYNRYTIYVNENPVNNIDEQSGTFISPADYDYMNNILYANAVSFFGDHPDRLLRSKGIPNSISSQFIPLGTGLTTAFSHVKYSRFSPSGTSTLFVGTTSGRLYKVTHAESFPEVEEIDSPDFPTANISCVALGNNENTILVTFSNYGVSSVWLTTDGGETWEEKEANLPDMPVRWAIFHPDNNDQALLATETGVWATNSLMETPTEWAPAVDGMANVRVDMLQIRTADDIVLAATHGRGLFTAEYVLDIYDALPETGKETAGFDIYPNPATAYFTLSVSGNTNGLTKVALFDMTGKKVLEKEIENSPNATSRQIRVDDLPTGVYTVMVTRNGKPESRKLIVR
ncbi:MAG: T9SS type A sorting domain-containing protein [Chlorobi bacterium]|nr:T9SS type A sorting domain-containing protein [Chlorobiota bacterium]